jgi:serine/threonine-protein kinase HipA
LPEKLVLDTAREAVALFHQHWDAEKKNLPLSDAVVAAVENHMKTAPVGAR